MSDPSPTQYKLGAFISYSTDDSEAASAICEGLESMGKTCWIAERDVRAGKDYGEEIINAIDNAACVVLVLSAASNASAFVKREVERAASMNGVDPWISMLSPYPQCRPISKIDN